MDNLTFDSEKYFLGKLCRHGHEWENTGKSLRIPIKSGYHRCAVCTDLHNRRHTGDAERHKERYSKYGKAWYEKNRDRLKEDRKKYRENNRERITERGRIYREQNREKIRESGRIYYRLNRESSYSRGRRRRALKKRNHAAPYSLVELQQHFEGFGNRCAYCGSSNKLAIDHFIAIANGGPDCLGNIVPSCRRCNSSKCNRDALIWYKRQVFYSTSRWRKILKLLGKDSNKCNQLPLL